MWGTRKHKAARMRRRLGAFMDEGSEIEGKYTCSGTVMLDAKVSGEVLSKDTLVIGSRAVVHATVRGAIIVVHGEVVGTVSGSERVELKTGSRVSGTIEAPVVIMEQGAMHDGECHMAKPKAADPQLAVVVPIRDETGTDG
jgi:cytoskeletal protein CcmA (bactofilin family)